VTTAHAAAPAVMIPRSLWLPGVPSSVDAVSSLAYLHVVSRRFAYFRVV